MLARGQGSSGADMHDRAVGRVGRWWVAVATFLILGVAGWGGGAASATVPALLGTVSIRASEAVRLPRWEEARRRIAGDVALVVACRERPAACDGPAVRRWAALLRRAATLAPRDRLRAVNLHANRQPYVLDRRNWGMRDYWASPIEFLERSGDCEDYAIFKYASLRLLGFSADDLRIVVLHDARRGIDHAVLAVHLDGEILLLDNVEDRIRTDREVPHYLPYYSVNERARWVQLPLSDAAPGGGRAIELRPRTRAVPVPVRRPQPAG